MAFRMRFNWRRTLFFFMILAFPLLVMNIVGKYREKHTPPEKRMEKMNSIISGAKGSLSLKEIRDVTNQYAALPKECILKEDSDEIEGFRRSMGWFRALKVMGFERVVVEGPSGSFTLLLRSKEPR